jgi:HEAT repeat protein
MAKRSRIIVLCEVAMRATGIVMLLLLGAAPAGGQGFLGKSPFAWMRELDSREEAARRNGAFALGKMGLQAAPAIPKLLEKLKDDASPKVREAAAFALGEVGRDSVKAAVHPDLVAGLAQALGDADHLVRRSAAFALGSLGAAALPAKEGLHAALSDPKPEVRQNAAWALGKIGPPGVPGIRKALGDNDSLVKRDAAAALAPLDPQAAHAALAELLPLCSENNSELRRAALTVLVKVLGPEDTIAINPIRQALLDADAEVRVNAALALSNIGGKETAAAVPVLLDCLQRGDIEVRRQAAAAFRNIGPEASSAVPQLAKALRDPDPETREYAALALGGIGPHAEAAIPTLIDIVADSKEKSATRIEAAVALSRIGPAPAAVAGVPTLLRVLGDPVQDSKVRERIVWSLRAHKNDRQTLTTMYPTFTKVLAEARHESTPMLRYDCAYMLGMLQAQEAPPQVLGVLLEFLKDETIKIFDNKKSSVGGTGQESATGKANVKELGKGDGRVMAVHALARVGAARVRQRPEIVQQLRVLADDPDVNGDLREACKNLLKSLR